MNYTTLISPALLAENLENPDCLVVDCRFTLLDPERGQRDYRQGHIPGAVYAHLDKDLSAPVVKGKTGRHPLPTPEEAARLFSRWGVSPQTQVVAYDDAGGALAAVRVWWMLRWLGHPHVAVLDGGWQHWLAGNFPQRAGEEHRQPHPFIPAPRPEVVVSTEQVDAIRMDTTYRLFDARTAERYHGRNETIDPVAGHIPGALSAPYLDNLDPGGCFLSPEALHRHYQALLGETAPDQAIFYCGSGVTSIHNILAVLHAGMAEPRLYAGSWSEWIADPARPVAV